MKQTLSAHKIYSPDAIGFDPAGYSRFKFGDGHVADAYGEELANLFIATIQHNTHIGQLVVIASPYSFIPTATYAMKTAFVYRLNRWLAANGHPTVEETKIHRTTTYRDDYGELNAEERMRLIGNDSFHIDRGFTQGKTLVFMDDIKITGSHEKMIAKMVDSYGLDNDVYMLYYAELANSAVHPRIENYLNYYCIKSVFDLEPVIKNEKFAINTRVVKYILNTPPDIFRLFIYNYNINFLNLLLDMALGNSYHTIDAYSHNINTLLTYIETQPQPITNTPVTIPINEP